MNNTNKRVRKRKFICTICQESHCPDVKFGDRVGDGSILARNIAEHNGSNVKSYKAGHALGLQIQFWRKGKQMDDYQLAAHHLICSEAMDDNDDPKNNCWMVLCHNFGYTINCFENGVFLPTCLEMACVNRVPLHRGDHDATFGATGDEGQRNNYVDSVMDLIEPIKMNAGNYCDNPEDFKKELDLISKEIFGYIKSFQWTITADGRDYQGAIGCMNCESIPEKRYRIYRDIFGQTESKIDNDSSKGVLDYQIKVSASAKTLRIFCDPKQHKEEKNQERRKYPLAISK